VRNIGRRRGDKRGAKAIKGKEGIPRLRDKQNGGKRKKGRRTKARKETREREKGGNSELDSGNAGTPNLPWPRRGGGGKDLGSSSKELILLKEWGKRKKKRTRLRSC